MAFFDFFKKNKNDKVEKDDIENLEQENIQDQIQDNEKEEMQGQNQDSAQDIEESIKNEITEDIEESRIDDEDIKLDSTQDDFSQQKENEKILELDKTNDIIDDEINNKELEDIESEENEESSIGESEIKEQETPVVEKKGFFNKIISGLDKTRKNIVGNVENVLKSFTKIDEQLYEELEEALILADIGVTTSMDLIEKLRDRVKSEKATDMEQVKEILVDEITITLESNSSEFELPSPSVILVIGVNGVGKTTTIGKLAANLVGEGKSVMLAAADTFRAAAIDQLQIWGERSNIPVIKHQENSDPASVVFDAIHAAKSKKVDVLICDTAGRLHNKKNLMQELSKISKIIDREYSDAHLETFIVLDATTGQNALQQAVTFKEICDITGIVLTKLDGTAKGGIVIAIKNELEIPIRFIGVGEGIDDLQPFNANDFAKALFDSTI